MYVFDFDGVLARSLETCAAACTQAARAQAYGTSLGPNPFADLNPLTYERLGERLGLDPVRFAEDTVEIVQRSAVPPLVEGMVNVFSDLSDRAPIAILSASHSQSIRTFLKHHDIERFVARVIGRDMSVSKSGTLARLQQSSGGGVIAMVGDSVSDIAAAHFANVTAIGVNWGWQSEEILDQHGAEFVARSPFHLLRQCLRLNGSVEQAV